MHHQSLPLTIGGNVLKECDDLDILGVTFDSNMTFRFIFARFPEQLCKGLVSWESSGEYFMIGRFFGYAFGGLSCPFRSTVLQSGAQLQVHLKLLDRVVSGDAFLNGHLFLSVSLLIVEL